MPDNYIDTVPLGQAGTGAAYILPSGSNAADRLLETIDYNQKVKAQNQQNKIAAARQMAESYRENAFKAKNGVLFNPELMALQQKHIQQGQEYAKQGFDVYNPNPNNASQMAAHDEYMADRAKLYNYQDVRDQLAKHLADQDALISKAKPGTYDPKSIQALHDYYNNHTLSDIVNNGLQAPSLQHAFDPTTVVNKLDPVLSPDTTKLVRQPDGSIHKVSQTSFMPKETFKNAEVSFANAPGGNDYVQEQTGLTIPQARALPDDLATITKLNDSTFKSTNNGRKALVQAGVVDSQGNLDNDKYQQLLQAKSQNDFANKQKYNSFINSVVDVARSRAKQKYSDLPDYTYENQQLKRASAARERTRFNERNKDKATDTLQIGNQDSNVPVIKITMVNGKVVPQIIGYQKNDDGTIDTEKPITVNSTTEKERGASLFSSNFDNQSITVTPSNYVDLKTGHSIKNTEPFNVQVGTIKMVPVMKGLDDKDSRNGAELSLRQLKEIVDGKHPDLKMSNIEFKPYVYGVRDVKDAKGHVVKEGVSIPVDAVRGNKKIPMQNFDKAASQFNELINAPEFKSMSAKERLNFLEQTFNIKD